MADGLVGSMTAEPLQDGGERPKVGSRWRLREDGTLWTVTGHGDYFGGLIGVREDGKQEINRVLASDFAALYEPWLVAMDEPGSSTRRTITLTKIIEAARESLAPLQETGEREATETYECRDDHGDSRTRIPHTHVRPAVPLRDGGEREASDADLDALIDVHWMHNRSLRDNLRKVLARHPHQDVEQVTLDQHASVIEAMADEEQRRKAAEQELERLRKALARIAAMGGSLASAGDVARAALASPSDEGER